MTDLLKLAERIEAGELHGPFIRMVCCELSRYTSRDITRRVMGGALNGSLDEAKRLHDAVLPGWSYEIMRCSHVISTVSAWDEAADMNTVPAAKGSTQSNPAAAWVAALLRAKSVENNNDP